MLSSGIINRMRLYFSCGGFEYIGRNLYVDLLFFYNDNNNNYYYYYESNRIFHC